MGAGSKVCHQLLGLVDCDRRPRELAATLQNPGQALANKIVAPSSCVAPITLSVTARATSTIAADVTARALKPERHGWKA